MSIALRRQLLWAASVSMPLLCGLAVPSLAIARSRLEAPASLPQVESLAGGSIVTRAESLRRKLYDLSHGPLLRKLRVGMTVHDARSGEEVFTLNSETPFNPASNTKIFTTAAALSVLGADFRFRTALWAPMETATRPTAETIKGDLFLQGSGDPSLQPADIADLIHDLARRGVQQIDGDIVLDGQFRDDSDLARAAPTAGHGGGALMLHRDTYRVRVTAGSVGHAAHVTIEPSSPYFVLHASVKTVAGKKTKLVVSPHRKDDHLVVEVRGRIGSKRGSVSVKKRVPDARDWIATTLQTVLRDTGIRHHGKLRIGPPPPGPLQVVADHRSQPLSEICRVVNKDSNNFVADVVWKTLGAVRFGLPQSLEKGARAVSEWLVPLGYRPERLHLVNGSGLTYENRVRPIDVGTLLRRLYHNLELGPEFMQSLAVGGIDGTIHHRFRGASHGLVRGKTGTLNGVSVLSGYVGSHPGVLVFTIFIEGFRPKRLQQVRQLQAQIVEVLLKYIRSGDPTPTLPSPAQPVPDSPDDEDTSVSDEEPL